jgi:hypothetical protein
MKRLAYLLCAAFLPLFAADASAAPITVPTDLNPGDQYRLAFETSTRRDASSSNIADYNAFVSAVANTVPELVALGTTWKAIGSTEAVDARDNTSTNPFSAVGVPIYRLDGRRIANNNADLWDGRLLAALELSETGAITPGSPEVWTGTGSDGVAGPVSEFSGWALGAHPSHNIIVGWDFRPETWVHATAWFVGGQFPYYAISGELTVVPEPGTMILGCLGALAVVGWQLRRRYRHRILRANDL